MSERFNPRIHSLDYASKRLDELAQESRAEQRLSEQSQPLQWYVSDTSGYLIREEIGYQPEDAPVVPKLSFLKPAMEIDTDRLRQMIEQAIEQALNPDASGAVDPRHFARVTFETDQGELWRGVVYPVEKVE